MHQRPVWPVAVQATVHMLIKDGADDAFIALKGKPIAAPVIGVEAR